METNADRIKSFRRFLESGDFKGILSLTLAEPGSLRRLSRPSLGVIAHGAKSLMLLFALNDWSREEEDFRERFGSAYVHIMALGATHYLAAMEQLVRVMDAEAYRGIITTEELHSLQRGWVKYRDTLPFDEETESERPQSFLARVALAIGLTESLLTAWTLIAFIHDADIADLPPEGFIAEIRSEALGWTMILNNIQFMDAEGLFSMLGQRLFLPTVDALRGALKSESERFVGTIPQKGWASLRPQDFVLLASRNPDLNAFYGTSLERAFERQLGLLLNSMGWAVVENRPGRRHVDLICLAVDPEPSTLVVEAKTTSSPRYAFRADEQRALLEHVREVKRTLRPLPPVRLVLLVAPEFKAGAGARLRDCSVALGIPCRGIPARLLVQLRDRHLGPLPFDVVLEVVSKGPDIVTEKEVDAILAIAEAPAASWKSLVESLRTIREDPDKAASLHRGRSPSA